MVHQAKTPPAFRPSGISARQARALGWGMLCLLSCVGAAAQETTGAAATTAPSADVTELAPVTVTARRREETEQSVPISMTVLQGDQLSTSASPTAGNAGLARSVPNLSFADTGGQNSNVFNLRGVGSFAPLSPDDTSVVVYTNDVPRSVYGAPATLLDVDRVEVLRGPQGTLFGRNTQGGAINIIANQPVFEPGYSLTSEVGTEGHWMDEVVANQPFSDNLAGRLAVRYGADDGRIPNLATGGMDGRASVGAARGTFLWTPGDRTAVTFTGFYDSQESTAPRFVWMQNPSFPQTSLDPQNKVRWQDSGASLKVEHEFDRFAFTSLSSYQDSRSRQAFDLTDGLVYSAMTGRASGIYNVPYADFADIHFGEQTWQQEFRLSSLESSPIAWTTGLNYFHSSFANDTVANASAAAFNFQTQNGTQANRIDTNSAAIFGEATVPLVGRLKGTLGLRYTHEDKDADFRFTGNGNPAVVPAFFQHSSLSDNFLTGRTGLSYDWTDDLMTYATVSRGYVTGGYPAVSVNTPVGKPEQAFAPSKSWTYEAGFKSQWLDHRLTVNGSVFFNDVKNGHLIVYDPSALLFTPATLNYQSRGAELELGAKVDRHITLTGGLGYTNAELVDVPVGSATGAVSGNRVPNVPRFTANAGVQFEAPASAIGLPGSLNGNVMWQYVGNRAVDVKDSFNLPAYSVVNARLGWQRGRWEIYAFAYNLFNRHYLIAGQAWTPGVSTVRVGQDRIVGLGATVKF